MEKLIDHSHLHVVGNWMHLWKAKVPQKFKLLLWRCLRNVLPTRENLLKKGVECTPLCPHCELFEENTWHVFYGCEKAIECWAAAGLWEDMRGAVWDADGFQEVTFHFLTTLGKDTAREFINTLWCIWRRRNDRVWRGVEVTAKGTVMRAREYMQDWFILRNKAEAHNLQLSSAANLIWIKPKPGEFKCNLDAALFPTENQFGVSMCIRGDYGQFIKAKTLCFQGSPTPQEAEAIDLMEGIS